MLWNGDAGDKPAMIEAQILIYLDVIPGGAEEPFCSSVKML